MKREILLFLLLFALIKETLSQIKWSNNSKPAAQIEWNNYSTSFIGDINDSIPFLVTAIPYNGMYSNSDDINTPLDLSFEGSLFRFRSNLSNHSRRLYTYDTSEVYFLTPGIYKNNAANYEYRVTLNAKTIITPWTTIRQFSDIQLNKFGKGFGYLGGYKANWGNYIIVELRKKGADTGLSSAMVYWKETKPIVSSIYTSKNLNEFFTLLKRHRDKETKSAYPLNNPVFSSSENSIIFYLSADIYNKEALEYQLMKNGKVYSEWKSNDYDNNFIWLKELPPGKYKLDIRYKKQRKNISTFDFEIKPPWDKTTTFRIIAGSLIAAFFGFIALLFRLINSRKKIKKERSLKERLHLELKAIYSQLNPHFIFNCLNSIQGLINKNDLTSANYYLSEFGSLLRNSLINANKDYNNLENEIATLNRYLKLEQLRFRFHYRIIIDKGINIVETTIPSLLLQPLLENAVKHGVSGMQEGGNIQVNFAKEDDDMLVIVEDNGEGFESRQNYNGHGLRITSERIKLLNGILNSQTIQLTMPIEIAPGAKIHILFKNWLS